MVQLVSQLLPRRGSFRCCLRSHSYLFDNREFHPFCVVANDSFLASGFFNPCTSFFRAFSPWSVTTDGGFSSEFFSWTRRLESPCWRHWRGCIAFFLTPWDGLDMVSSTSDAASRLSVADRDSMDGTTLCLVTATIVTNFSILLSITSSLLIICKFLVTVTDKYNQAWNSSRYQERRSSSAREIREINGAVKLNDIVRSVLRTSTMWLQDASILDKKEEVEALRNAVNKLSDERNLRDLQLKYDHMSTAQFKKRTTHLDIPGQFLWFLPARGEDIPILQFNKTETTTRESTTGRKNWRPHPFGLWIGKDWIQSLWLSVCFGWSHIIFDSISMQEYLPIGSHC